MKRVYFIIVMRLLAWIMLLSPDSAISAQVDRVCALPGYPKKQNTGIQISVDHTNGVFGYEVVAPNVLDNKPLQRITLRINDGDKPLAYVPLRIESAGSPESSVDSRAFFKLWPTRLSFVLDAEYGFPCTLTVEKILSR